MLSLRIKFIAIGRIKMAKASKTRKGRKRGGGSCSSKPCPVTLRSTLIDLINDRSVSVDDIKRKLRGINVNARIGSTTPLIAAAGVYKNGLIEALLEAGADLKGTDASGNTALHIAAFKWELGNVLELLEAGAEPNSVSANGMTPLMFAASVNAADIVTALMDYGAELNLRDAHGHTALNLVGASDSNSNAARHREWRNEVIRLLCERGAVGAECQKPWTAGETVNVGYVNIPEGVENAITTHVIEPGTNMVNFQDEIKHRRYYTRKTFNDFKEPKMNPFTRERITRIRTGKARVRK
jgi:hypothetical protein